MIKMNPKGILVRQTLNQNPTLFNFDGVFSQNTLEDINQ